MTPLSVVPPPAGPVATALAADRLGVPAVVFFVMSAATPFGVVAGVITTGYATTGLTGLPLAFVVVGVVLGVFSVGYVTMARYVANAGAVYSYVARGLGRPAGVGAAWVALLAYNALQIGLYGAVGAATQPLLQQWFGVSPPWWAIAVVAWAVTAALGLRRIDVNGRVLAVLLVAEVAVIMVYNLASLLRPGGGGLAAESLSPGNLFAPGVGALLVLAVLGFVGFEAAVVFSEESRQPRRTIRVATYAAVAVTCVLYTLSGWAMTTATGADAIIDQSREHGTELVFHLAAVRLGPVMADVGHVLFAASIVAAMISFHNTVARYMFALGRERVLPAGLGRVSRRHGAPRTASLWQSATGLTVITVYAIVGADPVVHLFYWAGTSGGLGVLLLLTAAGWAIVAYFARHRHTESVWRTLIAPLTAVVALTGVLALALTNMPTLLGVPDGHPLPVAIPTIFAAAALAGTGWALVLKRTRPQAYAAIGLGARSATTPGLPSRPGSHATPTA